MEECFAIRRAINTFFSRENVAREQRIAALTEALRHVGHCKPCLRYLESAKKRRREELISSETVARRHEDERILVCTECGTVLEEGFCTNCDDYKSMQDTEIR